MRACLQFQFLFLFLFLFSFSRKETRSGEPQIGWRSET